jgi:predicted nucleotidyltransferase/biotin operon repressor
MQHQPSVRIDLSPARESGVFRIRAADEILRLLVDAHETEFSVAELMEATGAARSTVWRALDLLDDLGVLQIRKTPTRSYVRIDPTRLQKDDPILALDQPEFHAPVRAFVQEVQEAITDAEAVTGLVGIVVFGSVARGEADRRSDIDLFVVVEGDRTTARRLVTDIVSDLNERRFTVSQATEDGRSKQSPVGERFAFEPYVESFESALRASEKLDEIFREGITVFGTVQLGELRRKMLINE